MLEMEPWKVIFGLCSRASLLDRFLFSDMFFFFFFFSSQRYKMRYAHPTFCGVVWDSSSNCLPTKTFLCISTSTGRNHPQRALHHHLSRKLKRRMHSTCPCSSLRPLHTLLCRSSIECHSASSPQRCRASPVPIAGPNSSSRH